ncbi:MAG: hypothetical protein U0791_23085 [Gemmataceae bacterium]
MAWFACPCRDAWRDESGIPRSMTHVTIWVFGSHGQEIAEVDYTEQTTFLATVEEACLRRQKPKQQH